MFSERNKPTTPVPKTVKVKQLQKELKTETSKWKELGFQLLLSPDDLRKIERDANKKSPRMCLQEAIEYWLMNGEDKTWEVIFDALEDDHGRLKSELENQYHADMEVAHNSTQLVNLLDEVIPDWYMFGQNIDVPLKELKSFKDAKAPDQCFSEMLSKWLNSGKATWEGLVEALIQNNNRRLAKEIEKKYIKNVPDDKVKGQRPLWYVGLDEQELEEDEHYLDVLHAVNSVVKWEELGLALKLKSYRLQEIRRDESTTADRRKEMLRAWLREGEATWKSLCLALDNDLVGEKKLARDIAKEHKVGGGDQGNGEGIPLPLVVNMTHPQQVSQEEPTAAFDSSSMQQSSTPNSEPSNHESSNPEPSAPLEPGSSEFLMDTTDPPNTVQLSQPQFGGYNQHPVLIPGHVTNPSMTGHVTNPSMTGHVTNPSMTGHVSNPNMTGHVTTPSTYMTGHVTNLSMPGMPAMPSAPAHCMGHASMEQGMDQDEHHSLICNNHAIPDQRHLHQQPVFEQNMEQDGHHSKSPSTGQKDIQASSDDTQAEMVHNNQYGDYKVHQNTSSVFTTAHSINHKN